eukprot:TRINITY_DN2680_c0_g1_i2.p1 TRINITY_DN2680_c0_g1~~TRINITY_DN2680_c0_g1_i2.p1  ORF type:complete len:124 (-),score=19.01 TRINITY_DN2680_c0_g1_i2:423-794(-)
MSNRKNKVLNTTDIVIQSMLIFLLSKIFAPKLRGNRANRMVRALLELYGNHGDGDAGEEDAEHGDGSVALPVLRPAVGASSHAPYLCPEISLCCAVLMMISSHSLLLLLRFQLAAEGKRQEIN